MKNYENDILAGVAKIISKLFNYPSDDVDDGTTAEDVNGWDSLSHTMLIMEVERLFQITLDPFTVSNLNCVGDLVATIRESRV